MADPSVPWYQDVRWILTTIIALWGAGLSSYEKLRALRGDKPVVTVRLGQYVHPEITDPARRRYLSIEIQNLGKRELNFDYASRYLLTRRGNKRIQMAAFSLKKFPLTLKGSDSVYSDMPLHDLLPELAAVADEGSVDVRPVARDAIGRTFLGDWMTIKLDA